MSSHRLHIGDNSRGGDFALPIIILAPTAKETKLCDQAVSTLFTTTDGIELHRAMFLIRQLEGKISNASIEPRRGTVVNLWDGSEATNPADSATDNASIEALPA
jgi:hypothetical protein